MPSSMLIGTHLTTPGTAPASLFVGPYDVLSTAASGLPSVPLESIRFEDNGSTELGRLEFDVVDMALVASLTDAAPVRFEDNLAVRQAWTGEVLTRKPRVNAFGRVVHVTCQSIAVALDTTLVPDDMRAGDAQDYGAPAGAAYLESDSSRLDYLLGVYGARLPSDASFVKRFVPGSNPGLLPQRFRGLTLRQAAESAAAQGNSSALIRLDPSGRLIYDLPSIIGAAPFAIRIGTPGGGEIAPEDLEIGYDASALKNAYYVTGMTAAGSGWVTDPVSILRYGRHEAFLDAPDADTAAKRDALGTAMLLDTAYPIARGSFSAVSPYDGWISDQVLTINAAPQFEITSPTTFRIVNVATSYIDATGNRRYDVQFGGSRASFLTAA